MTGKLYGIGVGPGDPELLTVKAKGMLEGAAVIAYPVNRRGEESTAMEIVRGAVDVSGKRVIELIFSMDPDDNVRRRCRSDAVKELAGILDEGQDIAMVTLGDVGVYSTYMYVDEEIKGLGYETEVVPGIPSFCSGAAKARIPLVIGDEGLAVVSMAKNNEASLESALSGFDNVVVMKAWNSMGSLLESIERHGMGKKNATVISNIGMEGEYIGPLDPEREYGYFTTVIVKKGNGDGE
ncbi:MAG: precorrin-2 C(20)-methyltransferase [Candidatus Methanomethylophilaceae archaeon]|jgi:precorrin-2/cobalt-factor-2 C20-methyltransferase|nr:precorrin-2 C(20)-methyltransferase [Candidatus Methanomethylophilaceae archaeon]NCA73535.1 precorrin-2 C(20)-methyltransferase [Gammaproteobacteria bacterium]MDD2936422.1 precorrin-2 C(20)-methyltransferase [Candidatus Methanomethylophilaceae archaeon]MDD3351685.1 precorrin-2 C(20)-methyltransferase [Candidatus Methanomethylophilaceae archaeon]MDD3986150.1 precorrin-2 C(20)-methyltransferase [Candidatus Methanomethylophilaceae archaeon]